MKRALLAAAILLAATPAEPDEATLYNLETMVYNLETVVYDLQAVVSDLESRVAELETWQPAPVPQR